MNTENLKAKDYVAYQKSLVKATGLSMKLFVVGYLDRSTDEHSYYIFVAENKKDAIDRAESEYISFGGDPTEMEITDAHSLDEIDGYKIFISKKE